MEAHAFTALIEPGKPQGPPDEGSDQGGGEPSAAQDHQGRQDPELFVQNDATNGSVFTADKVTYKVRHIYSGTVLDHRGLSRGNA